MEHFERVLSVKEKCKTDPDSWYVDILKERIYEKKQKPRHLQQYGRGKCVQTFNLALLLLLFSSSCRTINTYHYEERVDGTVRTVKDNGSNEQCAYWIKAHKNVNRINFFILQKEKVYLPSGMNVIINDSLYKHNKNTYHRLTTINNNDTSITYFLIHERQ